MRKEKSEWWELYSIAFTISVFLGICSFLESCDALDLFKPSSRLKSGIVQTVSESARPKLMSPRERLAFHRWLVIEMQEQVFSKPIQSGADVAGWANVLSQRASVEGVYHGLVLSTEYAALEKGKPADIKALRFFGQEMALLDFPAALESDSRVQASAAVYLKDRMGSSVYILKRELGERILREAENRKSDREKLAAWYSGIAVRWSRLDIPFGLSLRNEKDEVFHFNWAKENTLGMIQWELLNREHRILNRLGGIEFSPAGK